MSEFEQLKDTVVEYCQAIQMLVTNPGEFFAQSGALPGYRTKFLFALPPVLVYAVAESVVHKNPLLAPLYILSAYAEIAVWMVTLKFVIVLFGESRTFEETLTIASSVALVFLIAWIPVAGPPLAVLGAGIFTVFGLTHNFKMHSGAALTAVALPVVVTGIVGAALSFVLIFLSSIFQTFAGPQ